MLLFSLFIEICDVHDVLVAANQVFFAKLGGVSTHVAMYTGVNEFEEY